MFRRWIEDISHLAATVSLALVLLGYLDHDSRLRQCVRNERDIAVANLFYQTDHGGPAAPDLETLVQLGYLPSIPECRAGGVYLYSAEGDEFTVCCSGKAHRGAGVPPDHPHLNSRWMAISNPGVCAGTGEVVYGEGVYRSDGRLCREQ
ncbi:MAG: hypothetical protein HY319_31780 [Armatimonadetes bacterium]|nr:hypothetical protein [Armatimonadota bacterium]